MFKVLFTCAFLILSTQISASECSENKLAKLVWYEKSPEKILTDCKSDFFDKSVNKLAMVDWLTLIGRKDVLIALAAKGYDLKKIGSDTSASLLFTS